MPKTCCVPGCRSGYRGTSEKVSLFCLPSDADKREQWKRAIPRQEAGGFSFDSQHVRVCEKHFATEDVVWNDTFLVKGDVVSLRREKPKLRPDAVPRRFDGLPAYLSKPKPRSRSTRVQPATKRRRLSSPDAIAEEILPCSSTEASQTAVTSAAETACQTEEVVCPISELLAVKGQLRSTTQRLRRSQMKLAKMTALASRHKRQLTDTQKLSAREKLILDQCLMKANAKSPTAVRRSPRLTLSSRIPLPPETRIQGYVTLLTEKQTELRALDAKIQAQLSDEAFQADYATAWDYEHSICEIRARVHIARSSPSAVSGPSSSAAGGHTQDRRLQADSSTRAMDNDLVPHTPIEGMSDPTATLSPQQVTYSVRGLLSIFPVWSRAHVTIASPST
ncbi:hypothetical protein HPB48_012083 [Haemaphysalis longicornis]|uniref:THAP-type domain-containing protein n=1 Tax=Haemaphysalis longicornis TaxID=44386 RepID=A0A9J6FVH5_HAELO|nr:hypothetical protein HPB48_012083 [Haemaphysalis longicornis]